MARKSLFGDDQLQRLLEKEMPRDIERIMRNSVTDAARAGRDRMKGGAPRDEGVLRRAIKARRRRGKRGQPRASIEITKGRNAKWDAFYWFFVEYGTSKMSAKPYIRPAVAWLRAHLRTDFPKMVGRRFLSDLKKRRVKLRR